MNEKQIKKAIRRLNAAGIDDSEFRRHPAYSGKGMFGEKTEAISSSISPLEFGSIVGVRGLRWDNLGLDFIYY